MGEDHSKGGAEAPPQALSPTQASRRRLLRGGIAAAPVVLTVVSNPVMATGNCTAASSFASLNASRPDVLHNCSGAHPSWWGKDANSGMWPGSAPYTRGSTWNACGFVSHTAFPSSSTLLQVVRFTETSGAKCVAAHIAAALLNLRTNRSPGLVMDEARIKRFWSDYVSQGFVVPTAGVKWWDVTPTVVSGVSTGGLVGYLRTTMVSTLV